MPEADLDTESFGGGVLGRVDLGRCFFVRPEPPGTCLLLSAPIEDKDDISFKEEESMVEDSKSGAIISFECPPSLGLEKLAAVFESRSSTAATATSRSRSDVKNVSSKCRCFPSRDGNCTALSPFGL